MRTVISALEDGLYITDVKNVSDGYRIEFSDGETITIRHGRDGEDGTPGTDGQDGYTPVIGVRMDTDGIYYWTLDGEWLLDDQGNKMRVTGENGKDGADGEDGKATTGPLTASGFSTRTATRSRPRAVTVPTARTVRTEPTARTARTELTVRMARTVRTAPRYSAVWM